MRVKCFASELNKGVSAKGRMYNLLDINHEATISPTHAVLSFLFMADNGIVC